MADLIVDEFKKNLGNGVINMDTDEFKICLFAANETLPAAGAYETYAQLVAVKTEVSSGNGYTTTGKALESEAWTEADGTAKFDAADISWTAATFIARYAAIYSDTPSSPADPLVCYIDFGSNKEVTAGTFTVQFHANGILTLT